MKLRSCGRKIYQLAGTQISRKILASALCMLELHLVLCRCLRWGLWRYSQPFLPNGVLELHLALHRKQCLDERGLFGDCKTGGPRIPSAGEKSAPRNWIQSYQTGIFRHAGNRFPSSLHLHAAV